MTTAQHVGVVLVLAQLALMVLVLGPALRKYLAGHRAYVREWADLTAQVEAARADFDGLHTMPCVDAAAAVLVDELMPELAEYLSEGQSRG